MKFDLIFISSKFRDGDYAICPHAYKEMEADDVTVEFLVESLGRDNPQIIEKYTYSCLIFGWGTETEPLHAVVALGTVDTSYDTPILVTVYRPDRDNENRWTANYDRRKHRKK